MTTIPRSSSPKHRFAEMAGGATAECAAVCCCCPCTVVNVLALAVYKVPVGLCRRVLRRRRTRKRLAFEKGLLLPPKCERSECSCGCDETNRVSIHSEEVEVGGTEKEEAVELEKEMWDRFYGTGFWRSPSQRE